jgi:hypothetical protein
MSTEETEPLLIQRETNEIQLAEYRTVYEIIL